MAKKKKESFEEEDLAGAFKKALEKASVRVSNLVQQYEEEENNTGSSSFDDFTQSDIETIIDGNEDLQKFLMDHEKEFGEVSKERRAHAKRDNEQGLQQQSGLPHHPLLADTQRFDGISPNESPEATVNPEISQELEEHLESSPELVNSPQLRAALEQRKQMKAQMSQKSSPTPDR